MPVLLIVLCAIFAACGANESILNSGKENADNSGRAPSQTTFAKELEEFRTADFRYILVLRRKGGGEIDAEDRSVIKLNTADANRRVSADNGTAFIIGTNNQIAPKNMAAIYEHFAVEDYSPVSDVSKTANSNTAR